MSNRIFVSLVALTLMSVACDKSYSNGGAPPVPDEVKPFITKTIDKTPGTQPDYKVKTLDSGEIPLSGKSIQVRVQLFEDRRAIYLLTENKVSGGGPVSLTANWKSFWSYSNGVISIANVGDFKIDKGQPSGVLTYGRVDATNNMIPDKLKSGGLPMGMLESWMKSLE